jgi:short-subunit dehydrogenase
MAGAPDFASAPLVFITGASSGIGQALAAHYAAQGCRLALVGRRVAEMQAWGRARGLGPDRMQIHAADVAQPDQIVAAAEHCLGSQGVPDVVIACAGISVGFDTAERADLHVMSETFAINNVGLAATFHPFLDAMRKRGSGKLVGIASVAAIRGMPGHGAYCASKAGVVAYCESLRVDCRGSGVEVITLLPGYIATPMTARNPYRMPFLLSPETFAERAARAIAAGTSYRVIPWQMAIVVKLLRMLPNRLFDALVSGRGRKRRRGE